ncbi:hypothetical protein HDE_01690 [Halotydeus destructor]|nr:hypothetical protein HDE_01690 [Halotydeus destructor]
MKEAEVLIGTVDDFLNDEVVQEVAFTGLHKYEGILIHEAGAVDEPSLAALLSCNADKFILVGNSGSKDNYDCSSLFQRLVDSYERQHEQFSSEAKCSVISSYKPVAVKRWRRSDDEKNEVVWFPTATPPPSTAPVADRRQFINGQFVDVPASQQSTENRPSSSGQPNRPRGPLRQPHRRNTPTRGRNWAPPPQRN